MSYLEDRMKRKNGLLPALPTKKAKKYLNKVSQKKKAEILEQRNNGDDKKEDEYFDYWMKHAVPKCDNCGMEAKWLLEPQQDKKKEEVYKLIWRACQAHLLPKKKNFGFPSLRNNLDNHAVLFPSWGGLLCGCHGWYDSSWDNASTMDIWTKAKKIIIEKLIPLITESEKKNIPELLLKEIQK